MSGTIDWIQDNPETIALVSAVVLYVVRSVMPRMPDPSWTPRGVAMWGFFERLMFLPWDRWFGLPKLPGTIVPEYRVDKFDPREAPTKKDPR